MEEWLPLIEYSVRNSVSLSTLRRYIKANKIRYKVEHGRYLLLSAAPSGIGGGVEPSRPSSDELGRLEQELAKAREEIAELKTLVALYEEKFS